MKNNIGKENYNMWKNYSEKVKEEDCKWQVESFDDDD
jgi:hypothetical protein